MSQSIIEYEEILERNACKLFGANKAKAELFYNRSNIEDGIQNIVLQAGSLDFNQVLREVLEESKFIDSRGPKDMVINPKTRSYFVFFDYASKSLVEKLDITDKFCKMCNVTLDQGEEAYYFMYTTPFKKEGILVTNKGLYYTGKIKGFESTKPLLYENITALVEGSVDALEIYYNKEKLDLKLMYFTQFNSMLVSTCIYFKFKVT